MAAQSQIVAMAHAYERLFSTLCLIGLMTEYCLSAAMKAMEKNEANPERRG